MSYSCRIKLLNRRHASRRSSYPAYNFIVLCLQPLSTGSLKYAGHRKRSLPSRRCVDTAAKYTWRRCSVDAPAWISAADNRLQWLILLSTALICELCNNTLLTCAPLKRNEKARTKTRDDYEIRWLRITTVVPFLHTHYKIRWSWRTRPQRYSSLKFAKKFVILT